MSHYSEIVFLKSFVIILSCKSGIWINFYFIYLEKLLWVETFLFKENQNPTFKLELLQIRIQV